MTANPAGAVVDSRGREKLASAMREARALFRAAFREVLREGVSADVAEAAFPAYAHHNPLIAAIFWGRLEQAFRLVPNTSASVLDFGCGSGVGSYLAARLGFKVVATDLNLGPYQMVANRVRFPESIQFSTQPPTELYTSGLRFDAVLALDVLEHVDNVTETLRHLLALLNANGAVIVSLPTENALYRLGRRLAGRDFTGEYHKSNAGRIEREIRRVADIDASVTHPMGLSLFRILRIRARRI